MVTGLDDVIAYLREQRDVLSDLISRGHISDHHATKAMELRALIAACEQEKRDRDAAIARAEQAEAEAAEHQATWVHWSQKWQEQKARAEQAERERDLSCAQILMIGSEMGGDPKMDPRDQSDPRWTPTLMEAAVMRGRLITTRRERDEARAEVELLGSEVERMQGTIDSLRADLAAARDAHAAYLSQSDAGRLAAEVERLRLAPGTVRAIRAEMAEAFNDMEGLGSPTPWQQHIEAALADLDRAYPISTTQDVNECQLDEEEDGDAR